MEVIERKLNQVQADFIRYFMAYADEILGKAHIYVPVVLTAKMAHPQCESCDWRNPETCHERRALADVPGGTEWFNHRHTLIEKGEAVYRYGRERALQLMKQGMNVIETDSPAMAGLLTLIERKTIQEMDGEETTVANRASLQLEPEAGEPVETVTIPADCMAAGIFDRQGLMSGLLRLQNRRSVMSTIMDVFKEVLGDVAAGKDSKELRH